MTVGNEAVEDTPEMRVCRCGHNGEGEHFLAIVCTECADEAFCWVTNPPQLGSPSVVGDSEILFSTFRWIASLIAIGTLLLISLDALYDGGHDATNLYSIGTSNGARVIQHWPTYALGFWLSTPHPPSPDFYDRQIICEDPGAPDYYCHEFRSSK